MNSSKNIIIVVLIIVLVAVISWACYMLKVSGPKAAEAACKAEINTTVIPQLTAEAEAKCTTTCTAAVQQCQQTLLQIMQIPACAAALP